MSWMTHCGKNHKIHWVFMVVNVITILQLSMTVQSLIIKSARMTQHIGIRPNSPDTEHSLIASDRILTVYNFRLTLSPSWINSIQFLALFQLPTELLLFCQFHWNEQIFPLILNFHIYWFHNWTLFELEWVCAPKMENNTQHVNCIYVTVLWWMWSTLLVFHHINTRSFNDIGYISINTKLICVLVR